MSQIIQIRKRGTLTLPQAIRKKYHLDEGDPLTVVDLGEGFFISPKITTLPKLTSQIEELMKEKGITLDELISGLAEERAKYKDD